MTSRPALFLDRDGVIVEDRGPAFPDPLAAPLLGVAEAIARARVAGFRIVLVSNQAVVARGVAEERDVVLANSGLAAVLRDRGADLDGSYFCPHHPDANVVRYRLVCDCRKPNPGLLFRAARELELDLARSVMVGDRLSDVAAGQRAGCLGVLVRSGEHLAPPIVTVEPMGEIVPDAVCEDLAAAVAWMLGKAR